MKIEVSKLSYTKETTLVEEILFDKEKFPPCLPLIEVKKAVVNAKIRRYEEFIYVSLNIKADVILQCSYTLKPFDTAINTLEEMHFASGANEDDEDITIYKGNSIELDKYIYDAISASIPPSPKAPGAKLPNGGKDYRVISFDDFEKEKEEKVDPRFAKLDELEFDD